MTRRSFFSIMGGALAGLMFVRRAKAAPCRHRDCKPELRTIIEVKRPLGSRHCVDRGTLHIYDCNVMACQRCGAVSGRAMLGMDVCEYAEFRGVLTDAQRSGWHERLEAKWGPLAVVSDSRRLWAAHVRQMAAGPTFYQDASS